MYMSEKIVKALETKNPEKVANMSRTISKYMSDCGFNGRELSSEGNANLKTNLSPDTYAKYIAITSSGNESSIYAHVYDNNDNSLYWARLLDTSPESYAKIAAYAGLFMETFNQYMFINF